MEKMYKYIHVNPFQRINFSLMHLKIKIAKNISGIIV